MQSTSFPSIIIDNFKFVLLGKNEIDTTNSRWYVFISSENQTTKELVNFWVYPSTSELGLWRLLAKTNNFYYKGAHIPAIERETRPPGDYFYYDYVQQTCIYIELQSFINSHFDDLKNLKYPKTSFVPNRPYDPHDSVRRLTLEQNDRVFEIIDDPSRQIQLYPFILLQQIMECGEIETITPRKRRPDVVIKEFAKKLKQEYELLYDYVEIVAPYDKVFQERITIRGDIMKFPLQNIKDGSIVILYACIVKMTQIPTNRRFRNSTSNIARICEKDLHIMPFFLTTEDSTVNCFGVYTKYIPCGAFICKLFDYSNGYHASRGYKQCTQDEFDNNHCSTDYSYLGDRFDNIFPFNEWIKKSNLQPYSRKSGVKSASPIKTKRRSRAHSF